MKEKAAGFGPPILNFLAIPARTIGAEPSVTNAPPPSPNPHLWNSAGRYPILPCGVPTSEADSCLCEACGSGCTTAKHGQRRGSNTRGTAKHPNTHTPHTHAIPPHHGVLSNVAGCVWRPPSSSPLGSQTHEFGRLPWQVQPSPECGWSPVRRRRKTARTQHIAGYCEQRIRGHILLQLRHLLRILSGLCHGGVFLAAQGLALLLKLLHLRSRGTGAQARLPFTEDRREGAHQPSHSCTPRKGRPLVPEAEFLPFR